ncbi:MAG: hypothetical protein ACR2Q4_24000, partial [Geminicoccaceae bacterium]
GKGRRKRKKGKRRGEKRNGDGRERKRQSARGQEQGYQWKTFLAYSKMLGRDNYLVPGLFDDHDAEEAQRAMA